MLSRASAASLAVLSTALATAATPAGSSESGALLYRTNSASGLEVRAISPDGSGARTIVTLTDVPGRFIYRVALSPNGKTLAAQDDRGISAVRLSDGATRVVARNAGEFTWSPDSRQIAYRAGNDAKAQIDIVRVDGSGRRRLTRGRSKRTWLTYRSLEWAPNGRRIAFVKWQAYDSYHPPVGGRIAVVTMSGKEKLLPRMRPFVPASLAWTRNATKLAAGGFANTGAVVVRLDRGTVQYLRAANCCVGVSSLAWSPDGTRLAFLGGDTSEGDAGGVVRIGSTRAMVFKQFDRAYDPVWARDSRHFAFIGCQHDSCDVYLSDSDGRDVKRIEGTNGAKDLLDWDD
jgi:Tol biopolymer transport system component